MTLRCKTLGAPFLNILLMSPSTIPVFLSSFEERFYVARPLHSSWLVTCQPWNKLAPFLWFNDNAEAAAEFYLSVFPHARKLDEVRSKASGPAPQARLPLSRSEGNMNRELALKIVLALVGLLFLALVYPMAVFIRQEPALSMMLSLYVTLGVFLLLSIRNPLANRSLIAFTAWSSFAHAALMGTQAMRNMVARGELIGVAVLIVIGAALIALAP